MFGLTLVQFILPLMMWLLLVSKKFAMTLMGIVYTTFFNVSLQLLKNILNNTSQSDYV